jgi:hypothetical protein
VLTGIQQACKAWSHVGQHSLSQLLMLSSCRCLPPYHTGQILQECSSVHTTCVMQTNGSHACVPVLHLEQ